MIGDRAFQSCSLLEHIYLPSTLISIGDYAFSHCYLLKIILLHGVLFIGEGAFRNCESLEDISLPTTLTAIGKWAFAQCKSLRSVKLSRGIQMIKAGAFDECNLLHHVRIPTKALVITKAEGNHSFDFTFVSHDTFPHTSPTQTVITSECFSSTHPTETPEVKLSIAGILGLNLGWDEKRTRLQVFLAPYELCHKKGITTILELGLWKAKMDRMDNTNPAVRKECHVKCGSEVIIQNVVSFL